jgi:hypothetical protein
MAKTQALARTNTDESGHSDDLSPAQEVALAELLAGANDVQAAEAAGVHRQCVNKWRHHDADFVAALNRRRADLWEGHTDRIRALIAGALDVLADDLALDAGWMDNRRYRQAAAVHVLRAAGIYGASLAPTGETTAGEVGVTMALSEMMNRL